VDRAEYLSHLHTRFGLTRSELARVIERATGDAVAASRRLVRGDENEVHRVELTGGAVAYLRVSFPGTPLSKLRHEAWAMSRARDGGVPVPEVLATETIATDEGERTAMVIREATGRQLHQVLPSLDSETRSRVMTDVGRVLRVLNSIAMPGGGVPDDQGSWTDPATRHRDYIADRLSDCARLPAAGLARAEVDQVANVLEHLADVSVDDPVLCHGDVLPEHVFVDDEVRVVGLIDWGMWHAGPSVSELAGLSLTSTTTDFNAIAAGHGDGRTDPTLRRLIARYAVAKVTGQLAWLVTSGQTAELIRPTAALRSALTTLVGPS
jgi:aminoglycoside phosphotransferase (APT) family kinase protein